MSVMGGPIAPYFASAVQPEPKHREGMITMALHRTPEDHEADPPSSWVVVKVAGRCWHLDSSLGGGTFGYYTTKHAAEADKISGPYVSLYEKEGRWFAGQPVANWKPYVPAA